MLGVQFGEKVWFKKRYKKSGTFEGAKMKSRREEGTMVGVRTKSGQLWIAREKGEIVKTRRVRKMPEDQRWGVDTVNWVKRVLWNRGTRKFMLG